MPHLTRTVQKNIFETTMGPRPATAYTPSADHEHGDADLSVRVAMTPLETGPGERRLPGQRHYSELEVRNLAPARRGHRY